MCADAYTLYLESYFKESNARIETESIVILGLSCNNTYIPSDVPYFQGHREIDLYRAVAVAGYDAYWVLPQVIKSGNSEEIELYPIIEIKYGATSGFLTFDEPERNITADSIFLTEASVGLHIVNITIED